MPPWPRPAGGIAYSGYAYIRPSIAQVKIFVQGRISGTVDDRKLKKRLSTYSWENNVSGLFTFEWFVLIAKKTTFDLDTFDFLFKSYKISKHLPHGNCHKFCSARSFA